MARITRATMKANAPGTAERPPQSAQSERENQTRGTKGKEPTFMLQEAETITDEQLLEQQLLQTTYQLGAPSQSESSASKVPQDSYEWERDTAQKQVHLVSTLAGVKRKRDEPASPGEEATRVKVSRTKPISPNHTPSPEPSENPKSSLAKGATLYAMMEAGANQSAEEEAEVTQEKKDSEDGDDAADEESARVGANNEELRNEENTDESGTPPNESPDDSVQIELYGQEAAWNTILEGANMVGVSKARHERTKALPRLRTRVIKSLVRGTEKAGNYFETLIDARDHKDQEQIDVLEKRLAKKLNAIKVKVETLTEAAASTESSEVITDIYAHAMPTLVATLRWGLICQTNNYSRSDDLEELSSMISIQDTMLLLCKKARLWKAKPRSSAPIIKATTQKIFPYLQSLRDAFAEEHEKRTRVWQNEQSQSLLLESHERLLEKRRREKLENAREQERKRKIMANDLERRYKEMFGMKRNVSVKNQPQPQVLQRPSNTAAMKWTSEQDRALLIQLMKEDIRHLPGNVDYISLDVIQSWLMFELAKQRYLATLNTPLLQNKLPEHIRERALYFKDALEIEWGDRDFVHSIE